ncbi:ATP-binding cassette sub-family C member 5-like [Amphiura filiformis]|uniref:ATP-binding cassette sub-family C member 5-like n=1 Tax=Amphiura filiformis TaxID=82378 RepID=UPI003B21B497
MNSTKPMRLKGNVNQNNDDKKGNHGNRRDSSGSYQEATHAVYNPTYTKINPRKKKKWTTDTRPPIDKASWFSILTFSWVTPLFIKGWKGTLKTEDLTVASYKDSSKMNSYRLEARWAHLISKHGSKDASLFNALLYIMRSGVICSAISLAISISAALVSSTVVMRRLIAFTQSPEPDFIYGCLLVVAFTGLQLTTVTCSSLGLYLSARVAGRIRAALVAMVYHKILRLRSLKGKSVGEIINLCTNDSQRVFDLGMFLPMGIVGVFICVFSLVASYAILGWTAVLGTLSYIMFYPLQILLSKLITRFRQDCIKITDKRVRLMSEVITCIKLIKMYAWEIPFAKQIGAIRNQERSVLEKAGYVQCLSTSMPSMSIISASFTIILHTSLGYGIDVAQAFTYLALLNATRVIILGIPFAAKATAETLVAMPRVKELLLMEEIEPIKNKPNNPENAIEISKATFAWDKESTGLPMSSVGSLHQQQQQEGKDNQLQQQKNGEIEILLDDSSNVVTCLFDINLVVKRYWGQHFIYASLVEEVSVLVEMCPIREKSGISCEPGSTKSGTYHIFLESKLIKLCLLTGSLVGIFGNVGSGKSSLISALLGRMVKMDGTVALEGSIAFVSQQACIFNATVRENILFGDYDEERYAKAIDACNLQEDLDILAQGDETEIGERGINLSGGQKQRVSMARALYSNADVYLLDDPLSAVDTQVGQHIFRHCIKDALQGNGKSVVFVTHQLQYLADCDYVVLMRDGRISEEGKHNDLMAKDGEYANLIRTFHMVESEDTDKLLDTSCNLESKTNLDEASHHSLISSMDEIGSKKDVRPDFLRSSSDKLEYKGGLIKDESVEARVSRFQTVLSYIRACGGFIVAIFMLFPFVLFAFGSIFSNWWLSYWFQQGDGTGRKFGKRIEEHRAEAEKAGATVRTRASRKASESKVNKSAITDHVMDKDHIIDWEEARVVGKEADRYKRWIKETTLRATTHLHDEVFNKVVSCPMSFFDTTPSGRILNRFSKDMDEVDVRLPFNLDCWIQTMLFIIFTIGVIAMVFPWFLIAVVFLVTFFVILIAIFNRTFIHIKRVDNISRSPWFAHLMTTVQSLSTVHAYGKSDEFMRKFHRLLDENTVPKIMFFIANRWLAFRLDVVIVLVTVTVALCVVFTHGHIPPALAGLALSYTTTLLGLFQYAVRMTAVADAQFASVERIIDYIKNLTSEAPTKIKGHEPPADWPKQGHIKFEKLKMRYRDNLPLVLRGISFEAKPKEKIGIVGRTGSGKSSLGVSLFRLVEKEAGEIKIDDIDISTIGLYDLRSKLAIIPQDPVLFIGTIRYNLDPFMQYNDEEIWKALEKTYMKDVVSKLDNQLEAPVVENGDNFSVGERQLLCMARAVLRKSKILMLDEATAAIDTQTDSLVQSTIREAFSDCTLLTIAHRLQTVLDSDKIMVIDNGKVAEFDTPSNLLADSNSLFSFMVANMTRDNEPKDTGDTAASHERE